MFNYYQLLSSINGLATLPEVKSFVFEVVLELARLFFLLFFFRCFASLR